MIRFYLSRELSTYFGFKLTRWKRWAREFLPPDPLGGLQSGYARQYSPIEAFQVYLGGHLVSELKYSIPQAKIIVKDLKGWISDQYFHYPLNENKNTLAPKLKEYRIYIFMNIDAAQAWKPQAYAVRRLIDKEGARGTRARMVTERYMESWIIKADGSSEFDGLNSHPNWIASRVLYITKVFKTFSDRLEYMPASNAKQNISERAEKFGSREI